MFPVIPAESGSRSAVGGPEADPLSRPEVGAMSGGVCRGVLRAVGSWSRVPGAVRAGPRCEPRRGRSGPGTVSVFDRAMKRRQKNWAASLEDAHNYDYLRDEVRSIDPPIDRSMMR